MMKTIRKMNDVFSILPFHSDTAQFTVTASVFIPSSITINHDSLTLNSCIITYHKQMKYNHPQSNQVHPL